MIREGIRRVVHLGRRDRWARDVEDEIKLHLALRAEQLVAQGFTTDGAYDEAVRRFGPLTESRARMVDAARHRDQRMTRIEYFADLRQDLAFALRTLARQKGWTAITILTLALGVGATTAVFSAVSTLLLHPLTYPAADRVVVVFQQPSEGNNTGINVTIVPEAPIVRAWKGAHSFEALEAFEVSSMELKTTGAPSTIHTDRVEPSFPQFAGVQPIRGRMFTAAEVASKSRVALLGEGMWRTRFGGDSSVIGKAITLDDSIYTIIGVLPASLRQPQVGSSATDVWLPFDLSNDETGAQVVGRLRPGVDVGSAQRELDSLFARTSHSTSGKLAFRSAIMTVAQRLRFHDSLVMLGYSVALVLLVACANVAHLILARSTSRQREMAIRAALGAGRNRVYRQLLTESLLLVAAGSVLGVSLGWVGLRAIVALRPPALSQLEVARVDGTTLLVALAVTILTSVIFGVLGGAQSSRGSTHDTLKIGGGRSAVTSRGRARTFLVVSEMALSATLVVGATMLVRSVINLQRADLGFEPHGLYTVGLSVPKGHLTAIGQAELLRTVATRMATVSGVRSVALASTPPAWRSFIVGRLEIDGEPAPAAGTTSFIDINRIETGYFQTMGVRLVQGTNFTDTSASARQVIINQGFARKHWAGGSPLGKRIRVAQGKDSPWLTIVGVANDASTSGPASESSAPLFYTAAADTDVSAILVRTELHGSASVMAPTQALVRSLDPLVTAKIQSVEESISESIAAPRFVMLLLSVFTLLALVLAAVGMYGVMTYSVVQKTREIGIRVALGASSTRIARSVLLQGAALALIGSVLGGAAAAWGTKLIEHQLYGVARSDVVSFVAAFVVLIGAALVACAVPTRRALAVDPITAIRAE